MLKMMGFDSSCMNIIELICAWKSGGKGVLRSEVGDSNQWNVRRFAMGRM